MLHDFSRAVDESHLGSLQMRSWWLGSKIRQVAIQSMPMNLLCAEAPSDFVGFKYADSCVKFARAGPEPGQNRKKIGSHLGVTTQYSSRVQGQAKAKKLLSGVE